VLFFKFSNVCKISRAPAISLHSDNKTAKLQVPKFPFARKFLANGSTVYNGQNRSALWYSDESDKDSLEGIE
jgi:hypothetical protein